MHGLFGTERHTDVFVAAEYLESAPIDLLARALSIAPKAMRTTVFELRDAGVVFTPTVDGDLHVAFNSHHIAADELRNLARKLRTSLPRYERQSALLDTRFPRATVAPAPPAAATVTGPNAAATRKKQSATPASRKRKATAKKKAAARTRKTAPKKTSRTRKRR